MASILGRTPFVDKILSSCSSEQLSTLASLVNNPGSASTVYLYGNDRLLSESNKGVSYVQLMIDEYSRRYLNGFLVYVDNDHCGFFSFTSNSSHIVEIEIHPTDLTYVDIYENLSAEEFRRTLADMAGGGGSGSTDTVKWFFAPYSNDRKYKQDDFCSKDGKIYYCLIDMEEPEEWNPEHWDEVSPEMYQQSGLYTGTSFPIIINEFFGGDSKLGGESLELSQTYQWGMNGKQTDKTTLNSNKLEITHTVKETPESEEQTTNNFRITPSYIARYYYDTELSEDKSWTLRFPVAPNESDYTFETQETVPEHQTTVVFIKGFRTNLNGRFLSAYEENMDAMAIGNNILNVYLVCQITRGGEKLSLEQAKSYMKYMTGSEFVPQYNYDYPHNTLFVNKDDGSYWKPQWDETNGMVLWYVATPYVTTQEISENDMFTAYEAYYKYKVGNILHYGDDNIDNISLTINKVYDISVEGEGEDTVLMVILASGCDIVNGVPVIYQLTWTQGQTPVLTTKYLAEATPVV